MVFLLTCGISSGAYADLKLNFEQAGNLVLIKPDIGSEGHVIVRDALTISIRPEKESTVSLSFYKVMPSLQESDDMDVLVGEISKAIQELSIVFELEQESLKDFPHTHEQKSLKDAKRNESEKKEENHIIDGKKTFLKKKKISDKKRDEIILSFSKAKENFKKIATEFQKSQKEIETLFPQGISNFKSLSSEDKLRIKAHLLLAKNANENRKIFEKERDLYASIFKIPLFGPELVSPSGVLPYYQKTVENVSPGFYRFVFSDEKSQEVLETLDFEISKKDEITEEDIKKAVPDYMNPLAEPKK